jgi:hypothetical protein
MQRLARRVFFSVHGQLSDLAHVLLSDGTNDIIAGAKPGEVLLKVADSVGGV